MLELVPGTKPVDYPVLTSRQGVLTEILRKK